MFPVEIHIRDEAALTALTAQMASMRTWLDHRRFEPSTFYYRFTAAGMLFRVDFGVETQATMFAKAFGGRILTRSEEMQTAG
jgi:hypothetical protein